MCFEKCYKWSTCFCHLLFYLIRPYYVKKFNGFSSSTYHSKKKKEKKKGWMVMGVECLSGWWWDYQQHNPTLNEGVYEKLSLCRGGCKWGNPPRPLIAHIKWVVGDLILSSGSQGTSLPRDHHCKVGFQHEPLRWKWNWVAGNPPTPTKVFILSYQPIFFLSSIMPTWQMLNCSYMPTWRSKQVAHNLLSF